MAGLARELAGAAVLGVDRFHQTANAQNAHHPFHVVGQECSAISVIIIGLTVMVPVSW